MITFNVVGVPVPQGSLRVYSNTVSSRIEAAPNRVVEHSPGPNPHYRLDRRRAAMQSTEIWKPVVGYEGFYEVSNLGRVRSLDRVDKNGKTRHGRVLKPFPIKRASGKSSGHMQVDLRNNEVRKVRYVHALVLESFIGPRPSGAHGCHNDGDPKNNHVSNLRWDSVLGNMQDVKKHGTHGMTKKTHCPRGHELSGPNVIPYHIKSGQRSCRACSQARSHAYYRGEALTQELADQFFEKVMSAS